MLALSTPPANGIASAISASPPATLSIKGFNVSKLVLPCANWFPNPPKLVPKLFNVADAVIREWDNALLAICALTFSPAICSRRSLNILLAFKPLMYSSASSAAPVLTYLFCFNVSALSLFNAAFLALVAAKSSLSLASCVKLLRRIDSRSAASASNVALVCFSTALRCDATALAPFSTSLTNLSTARSCAFADLSELLIVLASLAIAWTNLSVPVLPLV